MSHTVALGTPENPSSIDALRGAHDVYARYASSRAIRAPGIYRRSDVLPPPREYTLWSTPSDRDHADRYILNFVCSTVHRPKHAARSRFRVLCTKARGCRGCPHVAVVGKSRSAAACAVWVLCRSTRNRRSLYGRRTWEASSLGHACPVLHLNAR